MSEQFEADQLHGSVQPAKPMKGDRPGDKPAKCGECPDYGECGGNVSADTPAPCWRPVTPPSAVPEQGEFERLVKAGSKWEVQDEPEQEEARIVSDHNKIIDRLASAHNRAMSAALARIAELEKYIQEMVDIAAENRLEGYRELANKCAELEARVDSYRHANESKAVRIQKMKEQQEEDMRGRKQQITQLLADKAELQAHIVTQYHSCGLRMDVYEMIDGKLRAFPADKQVVAKKKKKHKGEA
ncbi:hypothetical protein [Chlorobium sp.]|uniref:hypothetical protein n=1 Tax=Chlorobium sp. TaxID=1095 RepID=UPI003C543D00